jgi:hypothetical protein
MMMISHVYQRLHLPLAAKYYALAAASLAGVLGDDHLLDIVPRGILMAASADYEQGAAFSFLHLAEEGLYFRYHLQGKHPADIEETESVMLGLTVLKQFAHVHDVELDALISQSLLKLAVFDQITDVIAGAGTPDLYATQESVRDNFAEQLGAVLLSDSGAERIIRWRALGITWQVTLENDYETTIAGERFCALTQVLLADLASVELGLPPTIVSIQLSTSDEESNAEALVSNDGRAWEISVPRKLDGADATMGITENRCRHYSDLGRSIAAAHERCNACDRAGIRRWTSWKAHAGNHIRQSVSKVR